MEWKFQENLDFSELYKFIDVPFKKYSSSMVARLCFTISTIVKPDILIVDEILGVGDYRFQEEC
jgi:ABC-type polysaccharide/polyol phosphate transport system ATPase subunit